MKKKYIAPKTTIIKIEMERLLANSMEISVSVDGEYSGWGD